MTRTRKATYARFLIVFTVLGVLGVGSTIYVLVHERVVLPLRDEYSVRAEFSAADGIIAGTGQPVRVAGVNVGQITDLRLVDGAAVATLQLNRHQIPRVYANATATLTPITPLGDMAIDLTPGSPAAPALGAGATIGLSATSSPVRISDLMSRLDTDTRDYLATLLSSLGEGVGNRGADLRRALVALGPTIGQISRISRALAERRTQLAHFVHNLAVVTHAASQDGQLSQLVRAGNQTLQAMTAEDAPLRETISELPGTLQLAHTTIADLRPFSNDLGPTLTSLLPSVKRLPATLAQMQTFAHAAIPTVRDAVRPFIRKSIPFFRAFSPAVVDLNRGTPNLTGVVKTFNYVLNELGFVPGAGDQGFLFWLVWAFHNAASAGSTGDANGSIARGIYLFNCNGAQNAALWGAFFGQPTLCPK